MSINGLLKNDYRARDKYMKTPSITYAKMPK